MRIAVSRLEGVPPSWQLINGLWGLLLLFGLLLTALWVRPIGLACLALTYSLVPPAFVS